MPHQDQSLSKQAQPLSRQAPAPMRMLDAEELRAVVGGPEIKNGDGLTDAVVPASSGS